MRFESATALDGRAVGLLAVASAIAVANAYHIQPPLVEMGGALSISSGLIGILPGLSQIGLACGLAFLLPLADASSARRLLLTVIPIQIAAPVLFATGGSVLMVAAASVLIGVFGLAPFILPPSASLRVPASRVGQVTGTLTRGILLARIASGIIGAHFGWRAVHWIAAVMMAADLVLLLRVVTPEPAETSPGGVPYRHLIGSLALLLRTVPELRVAAAAASAAPIFGQGIDRSGPHATRRAALAGMAVAWVLLSAFKGHLIGMAVGLVVLDIGATIVDIPTRTLLYGLDAGIRSRLNVIHQVALFSGGAVLSTLVGVCWSPGGWFALCGLGVVPVMLAFVKCWRSDAA